MRTGVWTQPQTWRLDRSVIQKDTVMAWFSVWGPCDMTLVLNAFGVRGWVEL